MATDAGDYSEGWPYPMGTAAFHPPERVIHKTLPQKELTMNSAFSALRRRASTLFLVSATAITCAVATDAFASPFYISVFNPQSGGGGAITEDGLHIVGHDLQIADFYTSFPVFNSHYNITGNCDGYGCLEFDTQQGMAIFGSVPALSIGPSALFRMDPNFSVLHGQSYPEGIPGIQLIGSDSGRDLVAPALLDALGESPTLWLRLLFVQNAQLVGISPDGSLQYDPRETFVGTEPVPEPGSLLLLATGLTVLAKMRCRARRAGDSGR